MCTHLQVQARLCQRAGLVKAQHVEVARQGDCRGVADVDVVLLQAADGDGGGHGEAGGEGGGHRNGDHVQILQDDEPAGQGSRGEWLVSEWCGILSEGGHSIVRGTTQWGATTGAAATADLALAAGGRSP